jgi:hypothetical protein
MFDSLFPLYILEIRFADDSGTTPSLMMSNIDLATGRLAAALGAGGPLATGAGYAYAGFGTLGLGGPLAGGGAGALAALGPGGAGARGGARPPVAPDGY